MTSFDEEGEGRVSFLKTCSAYLLVQLLWQFYVEENHGSDEDVEPMSIYIKLDGRLDKVDKVGPVTRLIIWCWRVNFEFNLFKI